MDAIVNKVKMYDLLHWNDLTCTNCLYFLFVIVIIFVIINFIYNKEYKIVKGALEKMSQKGVKTLKR